MRWVTRVCFRPYSRVAFGARRAAGGVNRNAGALTPAEMGDRFTDPTVYQSQSNVTAHVKSRRKVAGLLHEAQQRTRYSKLGIDSQTQRELDDGRLLPLTPSHRDAARTQDDDFIEHRGREGLSDGGRAASTYNSTVHSLLRREADRRDHMMDKFGQAPTAREFQTLLRRLRASDDDDEVIDTHQQRLVDENGIYPTTRMDAFMLDDDSYFPEWVNALPYSVRDRVKYGGMGLTEDDEVLRVRLARLPLDARKKEWERLKNAKEYRAAKEETLTLSELRDVRQGKRRFHWLQRKRQRRAATLRRMALRKPEGYEVWPSDAVDYSQRLAFIAQHVENGVQTGGQWPLDANELARAKLQRRQEEAERTFIMTAEEKKLTAKGRAGTGVMEELLRGLDTKAKPFKKLSRKAYANRVNAVVHGDQDAHGRKYRKMASRASHRMRPHESFTELALEKEVRGEPRVNMSGLNHRDDEYWTRHHKSWTDGMPSTRYGS